MPSTQYCGSKSEVRKILAFDVHKQNCTHKLGSLNMCKTNVKQILEIVYMGTIEDFRQHLIDWVGAKDIFPISRNTFDKTKPVKYM